MISLEDQNSLFLVIANRLKKDVECVALGGTAMMYKQYKEATKDIDLVFNSEEDRSVFIKAITELGYTEKNIVSNIYPTKKSKLKTIPLMYSRDDERFDLFVKSVFKTKINTKMINRAVEIRDFNQTKRLRIKILADEDLVLLKAITARQADYDDIETIFENNKEISWDIIIDEAIDQGLKGDGFIILDLEETMRKLKHSFVIKKEYFDKIYGAFDKKC
tara:strand:+ start:282 stop:938 length:657 start_codon:yes stop_codon:yes gene_type:complete